MEKTTLSIEDQARIYGKIAIECKCGIIYLGNRHYLHKCPNCSKITNLDPNGNIK